MIRRPMSDLSSRAACKVLRGLWFLLLQNFCAVQHRECEKLAAMSVVSGSGWQPLRS